MTAQTTTRSAGESGFTLIEVMVTTLILTTVSAVVISGVLNMTQLNGTVTNRTAMFAGVRNATALLEQEVGQAGRVALPAPVSLSAAVAAGVNTVTVTSTAGMFVGERLVIGAGTPSETVTLTGVGADTITATFLNNHVANEPVMSQGAFSAGVIPPTDSNGNVDPNGSSGSVLKIFGDINGTGSMVYVEYTCDIAAGRLYRNQMDWKANDKAKPTVEQILVENIKANPKNTPCFTYQTKVVNKDVFVIGVAITLTVESQDVDPITHKFQRESKALLNVAPRNVFNAWQLASLDIDNRVQPTPQTIKDLLPAVP
jgi:prepilin-type N-terminal cleavage/methylation domain-containing protein